MVRGMMSMMVAAALALTGFSLPAQAQDVPTSDPDARCSVALMLANDSVPADQQQHFQIGMIYYIGKLIGHYGRDRAMEILIETAGAMEGEDLQPIVQGCGDELIQLGDVMQKL